jgi:DNA repair protein RadC
VVSDYAALSDAALLARLIGTRESRRLYKGELRPFFCSIDSDDVPAKCKVAKELVRRSLHEELRSGVSLTSPQAVRDYLRLVLASRPYEVFMCLWLDTQHRMLRADEAFRGTLSQTSVYPREIVKTALEVNAAAVIFAQNRVSRHKLLN